MSIKSDLCIEPVTRNLCSDIEEMLNKISEIISKNKDKPLRELDIEELFLIDELALIISLSSRHAIENNIVYDYFEKEGNRKTSDIPPHNLVDVPSDIATKTIPEIVNHPDEVALKNLPVSVEFDGKTLRVHTPYVFRRAYGKDYTRPNFLMSHFVNLALKKWLIDNKKYDSFCNYFRENLSKKLTIIVTRYTKKFKRNDICDNDNIETGRIINSIFRDNLYRSDNALINDYYVRYRETNDETKWGTEFIIADQNELLSGTLDV